MSIFQIKGLFVFPHKISYNNVRKQFLGEYHDYTK